jgi:primosomal protein N'
VTRVQTHLTAVDQLPAGTHPDIVAIHRARAYSAGHACPVCERFGCGGCTPPESALLLDDAQRLACPACGQNRRTTPGCHVAQAPGAVRPVAA